MSGGILILGGGLAGLFCALRLGPHPVTLLATAPLGSGASSAWAQGGIAAAIGEGDSPEQHTADTVVAGAGLVDRAVTLAMAQDAPARIADLLALGVPFDQDQQGRLVQSQEAAHSARRIVRVGGDRAGAAIMAALKARVLATPSIRIELGSAEELVVEKGRVCGAVVVRPDGTRERMLAAATVLATGGIGHLYRMTTNPAEACGLGLGMAALAGAVVADPEFVQFHPTAIDIGRDPAPLATEALRGDGAVLIDRDGRRFMRAVHPDAELAPRDIVARAVFAEIMAGRGAFLDARQAIGPAFDHHFPTVAAACRSAGVDPVTMPIPVAPAEHYHMGGIRTDARGRTSLPGLWAIGEVASTGVHGANRLASNSLLEAVVFAARVAADLAGLGSEANVATKALPERTDADDQDGVADLRETMSRHVGVVRTANGLSEAVRGLGVHFERARSPRVRVMASAALLVAVAALERRESRGGHYRSDYPTAGPVARRSFWTWAEVMTQAARTREAALA